MYKLNSFGKCFIALFGVFSQLKDRKMEENFFFFLSPTHVCHAFIALLTLEGSTPSSLMTASD